MKEIIRKRLSEIQAEHNISLLFACESGSRAWGFPSPDSDYDVRFIYTRPIDYYLSIEEKIDFIDYPEINTMDIGGWDLMKVLRLMRKSNTTIFEWLQSPIIYSNADSFQQELWALSQGFFCAKSNMHHYLGIATGAMETIVNANEIKIKKLFYILRPLLAAKWCYEKRTIAPMSVFPLLNLLPGHLQEEVQTLIAIKEKSAEGFKINVRPSLLEYIRNEMQVCAENAKYLNKQTIDTGALNDFFKKILHHYDH